MPQTEKKLPPLSATPQGETTYFVECPYCAAHTCLGTTIAWKAGCEIECEFCLQRFLLNGLTNGAH